MKLSTIIKTVKTIRKTISEPKLFTKSVTFGDGHKVEAVYEDSLSTGSSIGTVVGFHGAPGSHNDFKYIRKNLDDYGIRFIGLNYPGFSNTKGYVGQRFTNADRQLYTDAMLDELNIPGKIVYLGHSRGSENALQTAAEKDAYGLVVMNAVGLRRHRTISPQSRLQYIEKFRNVLPFLADPMIFKIYKVLGFRVTNSEECVSALLSMIDVMLDAQIPHIEKINNSKTKVLYLHAGSDSIIEPDIILEAIQQYKGLVNLHFKNEPDDEQVSKIFKESGKGAAVFIEKDTHFQNKSRADLVSKSIREMLLSND